MEGALFLLERSQPKQTVQFVPSGAESAGVLSLLLFVGGYSHEHRLEYDVMHHLSDVDLDRRDRCGENFSTTYGSNTCALHGNVCTHGLRKRCSCWTED